MEKETEMSKEVEMRANFSNIERINKEIKASIFRLHLAIWFIIGIEFAHLFYK
jgi:hypothetical protein